MRIHLLETRRGSEDGFCVRRFCRGRQYDVADALARDFIRAGWAVACVNGTLTDKEYAMTMLYDPLLRRDFLHMTRNRLLERVTAPVEEPVTLDEAKLYLRVDTTKDDTLIGDLIVAARMVAEGWLRRSLISQSWKMAFDGGIAGSVGLAMGPVSAITGVTVVNQDGGSRTLDGGSYWLNAARSALVTGGAVMGFRVEVTYVAGYGADTDAVPRPIKQGMLSHIGAMYDHRGEDGGMALPEQAMALYAPFREVHV